MLGPRLLRPPVSGFIAPIDSWMLRPAGGGAPKHPAKIGTRNVIAITHAKAPLRELLSSPVIVALMVDPQLIRESWSALYMNTTMGDKRNNKIGPLRGGAGPGQWAFA